MYRNKTKEQLTEILSELNKEYAILKNQGLQMDMSRGKPCPEQLDLSMYLLDILGPNDFTAEDGADCRNYGDPDGIPEAKRLTGAMLGVQPENVFVGGGSSLNLLHDLVSFAWLHPMPGNEIPWGRQGTIKFLCPVPGFDRHFAICKQFGIEQIPVPMTDQGPDMDVVEQLVASDPAIKGIWCVPKYSNPTGITYSDETVRRLAALTPAAGDFRIFWDNAYAFHDLYVEGGDELLPLAGELEKSGREDMAFQLCSFAKITFGGAGIAAVGSSAANIAWIKKQMSLQIICNDKLNQLRHARAFPDLGALRAHMAKHSEILTPKFRMVLDTLERELGALEIARWTNPRGGYFISLTTLPGCARRTVALCKEAGLVMTPAGATFPHGDDPEDANVRIAPSYPSVEELEKISKLLCLCVKIASAERLISGLAAA